LYSARAAIDTHSKPTATQTFDPDANAVSAQNFEARIIHAALH